MEKSKAKRQAKEFNCQHFAIFNLVSSTKIKKLGVVLFKVNFLSISAYIQ